MGGGRTDSRGVGGQTARGVLVLIGVPLCSAGDGADPRIHRAAARWDCGQGRGLCRCCQVLFTRIQQGGENVTGTSTNVVFVVTPAAAHLIGRSPVSGELCRNWRRLIGRLSLLKSFLIGSFPLTVTSLLQQEALSVPLALYGGHTIPNGFGDHLVVCFVHKSQNDLRSRRGGSDKLSADVTETWSW